ncbi:MAG: ankyrin repeat domain-containing protein [Chryseolinea sp.]
MDELLDLIRTLNHAEIRKTLSNDPALANKPIPMSEEEQTAEHPLHRICDGVFHKIYTDEDAVELAKIFVEFGADVNGNKLTEMKDTPLIAASSLSADQVGLLYIDRGANIFHPGTHGGTALHWAAWCGRDLLVDRLIDKGAEINRLCYDFKSTPLFWAIHGLKNGGVHNQYHQIECARLLLKAGADKAIPNANGNSIFEMLEPEDIKSLGDLLN